MKALSCFVIICGVLVSSDLALGFTFGVRQLESENKSDGKVAPAEDGTSEVMKKVEQRIDSMKQALIRDINNQETAEANLIQTLRNSTSKQLKIVGDKIIQVEEKVVSTGTKDNGTIAIYKIIKYRPAIIPVVELVASKVEKESSDSDQSSNQISETPEKSSSDSDQTSESPEKSSSSDQSSDQVSETPEESDSLTDSDLTSEQVPETSDSSSDDVTKSENTQPAETQSSVNAQTNQPIQEDQTAQNESVPVKPVIEIKGPDGVRRPVRGIAIRVGPKTDGSEGKNIALQFFKK